MKKDPRRDRRPSTDEPATGDDVPLDPVAGTYGGLYGGSPLGPRPVDHVDNAPGTDDDVVDPSQERMNPDLDTPELRPAVLGRLEGIGLIMVVRNADGTVAHADGTWRPGDETASRQELRSTFPEDSITRFAGTLVEARDEDAAKEVSLEVVIRRHGEYDSDDGRTLHIVNFEPRDYA